MLGQFFRGLGDFRRGASFVATHPRLWRWIAAPLVLTALLFVALAWGAVVAGGALVDAWLQVLPGWAETLAAGAIAVLLAGLVGVLAYFVFAGLAMVIAAPFSEMLSEEIEALVTGAEGERFSPTRFVGDLVVGLIHGLRRLIKYLVALVFILLVGALVPGAGPIAATVLTALVTARFTSYDVYDAVLARKRWPYASKRRFLAENRARTFALGGTVGALLLVPVANLIALPLGAAGATLGYLELSADSKVAAALASARSSRRAP